MIFFGPTPPPPPLLPYLLRSGATIRRISADTNVRIFVPSRKEEGGDVQVRFWMYELSCRRTYILCCPDD